MLLSVITFFIQDSNLFESVSIVGSLKINNLIVYGDDVYNDIFTANMLGLAIKLGFTSILQYEPLYYQEVFLFLYSQSFRTKGFNKMQIGTKSIYSYFDLSPTGFKAKAAARGTQL